MDGAGANAEKKTTQHHFPEINVNPCHRLNSLFIADANPEPYLRRGFDRTFEFIWAIYF